MIKKITFALTPLVFSLSYGDISFASRQISNYDLMEGPKIVYRGMTKNPQRREGEHIRDGKKFTHMTIKGKKKTLKGARKTEKESLETYRKGHGGKNPKYNKKKDG